MEIALDSASLATCQESETIHLLPCRISHSAIANIDTYFVVTPIDNATLPLAMKDAQDAYDATFRGRALQGQKTKLPANYKGYVFQETTLPLSPSQENYAYPDGDAEPEEHHDPDPRRWSATHQFTSITVWDQDQVPRKEVDPYIKAMEWLEVASILHDPIPPPPSA
ncbi:ribonuclease H2, subunit C [Endogone sp. FLAS-F59071]|nr:ribonuclease H2, subunit C [Endogone sp. FLAS-F59071]|eukprot:RUS15467.1 ribonuclease H2, subunit C [Endogone sp. FLAS-F59071]